MFEKGGKTLFMDTSIELGIGEITITQVLKKIFLRSNTVFEILGNRGITLARSE